MRDKTLAAAVHTAMQAGDLDSVRVVLTQERPVDLARMLEDLDPAQRHTTFELLTADQQPEVLGYLSPEVQVALVQTFEPADLAPLFTEMMADDRADLFQRLHPDTQARLLPCLAKAAREDVRRLAAWPEGTVGSVMTSEYATVPREASAKEALAALREQALDKETIQVSYVVDQGRLVGRITLPTLVVAPPDQPVLEVMDDDPVRVRAHEPQEDAAQLVADYDLFAVPVVDDHDRLLGIVTHDDALDIQRAAATRDVHRLGSVAPLTTHLTRTPLRVLYRKRVAWLVLLVFANIFSGAGIAAFEELIAAHVALVFFLPLLIDSGGNAGSQAATLVIRGMATGEVHRGDGLRLLARELAVATLLALTMAAAVSGVAWWRGGADLALVVSLAMVAVVLHGSLVGSVLPFLLERLGIDPATASAPLITTIADAVGVLLYFGVASTLLTL